MRRRFTTTSGTSVRHIRLVCFILHKSYALFLFLFSMYLLIAPMESRVNSHSHLLKIGSYVKTNDTTSKPEDMKIFIAHNRRHSLENTVVPKLVKTGLMKKSPS